ncbi:hypothetical protein CTI14_48815, partial [Methylobacterium radiotolerans]
MQLALASDSALRRPCLAARVVLRLRGGDVVFDVADLAAQCVVVFGLRFVEFALGLVDLVLFALGLGLFQLLL